MPTKTRKPLNTVILQGRVATELEYSTSNRDVPLLKFGLAVDAPDDIPRKIGRDGRVEPDFPHLVVSGPLATELVASGRLKKNTDVYVRGSWRTRNVDLPRRMVVNEMWATVIVVLDSVNAHQAAATDCAQVKATQSIPASESLTPVASEKQVPAKDEMHRAKKKAEEREQTKSDGDSVCEQIIHDPG